MTSDERAQRILKVLDSYRFRLGSEANLQAALERVMQLTGLAHHREYRLSDRDRIDFLVGRVGIELKVQGGWRAVMAQLARYAQSDEIDVLILVTAKATHLFVPREIEGKPVHVYRLTNSAL